MASSSRIPWQTKARLHSSRLGACVVATDTLLYVVGGLNTRGRAMRTVELYSYALNQWYAGPPLPEARYCAAAVVHNRQLWVLGGFTGIDRIPTSTVFIWNQATRTWDHGPELLEGRGGHRAAVLNEQVYIAGGKTISGVSSDFTHFGSNLVQWEQLSGVEEWDHISPILEACESAAGGFVNGLFVLSGGKNNSHGISTTQIYDEKGGWYHGAALQRPRWGAATGIHGSHLLVAGGHDEHGAVKTVEAYNILTNSWISLPDLPHALHGAVGAVANGIFYVIGGGTEAGVSFSRQLLALTLQKTPLFDTAQSEPARQTAPGYSDAHSTGRRAMPY